MFFCLINLRVFFSLLKAASWYCTRFGFKHFLYQGTIFVLFWESSFHCHSLLNFKNFGLGLETGERNVVTHAVKQNNIVFVFKSALNPTNVEIGRALQAHGDCVKDVSFTVNDIEYLVERAIEHGAKVIKPVWQESDEHGYVKMATLQTVC